MLWEKKPGIARLFYCEKLLSGKANQDQLSCFLYHVIVFEDR